MRCKSLRFSTFLLLGAAQLAWGAADPFVCENRVGGDWDFGHAPDGCDASTLGDADKLKELYKSVIYTDKNPRSAESKRYISAMFPVLRDAAKFYYLQRKPGAGAEELRAWAHAVYAVAQQETYWTQFRNGNDGLLKFMRGDSDHGHGMMQLDDRSHAPIIKKGKAVDLIGNVISGLDIYFAAWKGAASASCVGSATNWRARARAAYAGYNGGPSQYCRWTRPGSRWAQNDEGFVQKYDSRDWEALVSNVNAEASVDVACIAEGRSGCSNEGLSQLVSGAYNKFSGGGACFLAADSSVKCVSDARDLACLTSVGGPAVSKVVAVRTSALKGHKKFVVDRHAACEKLGSISAIGTFVKLVKPAQLKAQPKTGALSTVPSGTVLQVLDFEVQDPVQLARFYRVRFNGSEGYVYGGTEADHAGFAVPTGQVPESAVIIGIPTSKVKVVNSAGIVMRNAPNQSAPSVRRIANGESFRADEVLAVGDRNEIYYRVDLGGKYGFVYSGQLSPKSTLGLWTKVTQAFGPMAPKK